MKSTSKNLSKFLIFGLTITLLIIMIGKAPWSRATDGVYQANSVKHKNGQLLSYTPFTSSYFFFDHSIHIKKFSYLTENSLHYNQITTGALFTSNKPKAYAGKRALVVIAPGTQGQGRNCGLTTQLSNPPGINDQRVTFEYEMLPIKLFLDKGYSVATTNYLGLAAPGVHTYLNRIDEAHAVLDAARAVQQIPGSPVTSSTPTELYGYSQGGGAVAAAAELQPTYAADIPLKAAFSGAPPANLPTLINSVDKSIMTGVLGYAANSMISSDQLAGMAFRNILSPKGKRVLHQVANQCAIDTMLAYKFDSTKTWFTNGKSFAENVKETAPIARFIAAQNLGTMAPHIPILVVVNQYDDLILPTQAKKMVDSWQRLGADGAHFEVITSLPQLPAKTALNHFSAIPAAAFRGVDYLISKL